MKIPDVTKSMEYFDEGSRLADKVRKAYEELWELDHSGRPVLTVNRWKALDKVDKAKQAENDYWEKIRSKKVVEE
jgi:hypothetical protein